MIGATLFSGIGAPELAAPSIDWRWAAETEPFACHVLAARHGASRPRLMPSPDEPGISRRESRARAAAIARCAGLPESARITNHGDVTQLMGESLERPDIIVFGSPCQDFSLAGRRGGLAGERGNLSLIALDLVERLRPRWFLFENVPGLLSNWSSPEASEIEPGGERVLAESHDFAAFLGAVQERGYLGCWRVFDAQFAGLAQRRERLFFVGYSGDWRPPAAVLFEPYSLHGDCPPSIEARARARQAPSSRARGGRLWAQIAEAFGSVLSLGSAPGIPEISYALNGHGGPHGRLDASNETFIAEPIAFSGKDYASDAGDVSPPLRAMGHDKSRANAGGQVAIAFDTTQITHPENRSHTEPGGPAPGVSAKGHPPTVALSPELAPALRANEGPHGNSAGIRGDAADPLVVTAPLTSHHGNARADQAWGDQLVVGPLMADDKEKGHAGFLNNQAVDAGHVVAQAFKPSHFTRDKDGAPSEITPALSADADKGDQDPLLLAGTIVRRLSPVECERLQGFPDNWTRVAWRGRPAERCPDGPRYRVIGNSMAVPVVRWILERIAAVDAQLQSERTSDAE